MVAQLEIEKPIVQQTIEIGKITLMLPIEVDSIKPLLLDSQTILTHRDDFLSES
jgi:hypothetical protein